MGLEIGSNKPDKRFAAAETQQPGKTPEEIAADLLAHAPSPEDDGEFGNIEQAADDKDEPGSPEKPRSIQ